MSNEHDRLVRKLQSTTLLSSDEQASIGQLPMRLQHVEAGVELVREGDRPSECCLLVDGVVARHKIMPSGGRQIMALHVPGDLPDLQSLFLKVADHGIGVLAPGAVAFIPHAAMHDLMGRHEGIARAIWRDTLVEASIFREWIANVGSRPAYVGAAHLLCEFFIKMQAVGLAQGSQVRFPLTQADLADCLGLSVVHANRVLQQLRGDGLIQLSGKTLTIPDMAALRQAGEFDPLYLHLHSAAA